MRLSVIFWTRGNAASLPHLQRIFRDLEQQTFQDFQVIVVVDRKFEDESEFKRFLDSGGKCANNVQFFTNLNSDFVPSQHNASYTRNFGIQQADTELIQLFDDDNGFDEEYLEKAVKYYDEQKEQQQAEVVICSSMYYRDTGEIQNQGFSKFRYWQGRAVVNRLSRLREPFIPSSRSNPPLSPLSGLPGRTPKGRWAKIQMFSGNGLLGNAELFKSVLYDEQIAWIAEDLDFTLSLHERGAKLFTYADLVVRHYEREKTKLEQAWIGSEQQAQQKARNWFLFVSKHGKFWDKVVFLCIGLPGCLVWLSMKALFYGGKQRFSIIRGLFRGVREGWSLVSFFGAN